MKMIKAAIRTILLIVTTASCNAILVWPQPRSIQSLGDGTLIPISPSFAIVCSPSAPPELSAAAARTRRRIFKEQWSPVGGGGNAAPPPGQTPPPPLLLLNVTVDDPSVDLQHGVDESYELLVEASGGTAHLAAATTWGAIHGLETFSQLVSGSAIAAAHVHDSPLYPHRGVMIDTSRNFYPVASLLRTIAAMGFNKLNVFHWHITDSHSFPLALGSEPRLAAAGSYGPAFTYGHDDVARIISFARSRAVRVVPEIDAPGHAASWGAAYPNILTCLGKQWWNANTQKWNDRMASEPGAGQLNPMLNETYRVVGRVIDEVASLFPDQLYHAGGDEVAPACWKASDDVAAYVAAGGTLGQLLSRFVSQSHAAAASPPHNKTVVFWEDVLLDPVVNVTTAVLPPATTVIQTWNRGAANTKAVTSRGYRAIVSSSDFLYLDCGHGDFLLNDSRTDQANASVPAPSLAVMGDAADFNYGGTGGSWCAPFKSWSRIYAYDLTLGLSPEEAALVMGAEAALWSEQADATVVDARLWPRAAALAELLWSGNKAEDGSKRTGEAGMRLAEWRERLVGRGVGAEPMMPRWCLANPGMCNLNV